MNREEKIELLKDTCTKSLLAIGEDPQREGLQRTPERLARTFLELTRGYAMDPVATLKSAVFHEDYDQMVVVKDIEFYSLCEHHILPFFGKVHVAYIPNGNIVGLSKIPRMDLRLPPASPQSPWCYRGGRGSAHVHADAWHREARIRHSNHLLYRCFREHRKAQGIPELDQTIIQLL